MQFFLRQKKKKKKTNHFYSINGSIASIMKIYQSIEWDFFLFLKYIFLSWSNLQTWKCFIFKFSVSLLLNISVFLKYQIVIKKYRTWQKILSSSWKWKFISLLNKQRHFQQFLHSLTKVTEESRPNKDQKNMACK